MAGILLRQPQRVFTSVNGLTTDMTSCLTGLRLIRHLDPGVVIRELVSHKLTFPKENENEPTAEISCERGGVVET